MMIFFLLMFLSASFIEVSIGMNYECTDNDCWDDDGTGDPRKPYLDLYNAVEWSINKTLRVPSWKMYFKFYDGKLNGDPNDFMQECSCPLIVEEDNVFVTFHSYYSLELWYSYKFPTSKGKDGQLQISFEFWFSSLLLNQTNHPPVFKKVTVTDLHIISFITYGIPMEWLENLPDKYMNQLQKAISAPIKRLVEDALLREFNDRLQKIHSGQVPHSFESYGIHSNLVH